MSFGRRQKALRVTDPKGAQRSSHYLGLPFRYAIPLQIGSIALHWLASQSLYVVSLAVFDWRERPVAIDSSGFSTSSPFDAGSTNEFYRTGFSCFGLVLSMAVCVLLLLIGWIDDFRVLLSGMPLVGSSSVAISASCHAESKRLKEMVLKPLRWGVVGRSDDIAHCSFTDQVGRVTLPDDGEDVCSASRDFIWCPKHWKSIRPHDDFLQLGFTW